MDRRNFLRNTTLTAGALAGSGALGFTARGARLAEVANSGLKASDNGGYGPLVPAGPDLLLPAGFSYIRFSLSGEDLEDGGTIPGAHDGMAAFPGPDGTVRLVRNHEEGAGEVFGDVAKAWDPAARGGTTTVEVDLERAFVAAVGDLRIERESAVVRTWTSLNGTVRNCAGGPTPWGTWLSCEETTAGASGALTKPHGYVFEVDPRREPGDLAAAVPIPAMGRFNHEAVAVDPDSGYVYLTEDAGASGIYRYRPDVPGELAQGGDLEMLAVAGEDGYDTSTGQEPGAPLAVTWVPIEDPDPAAPDADVGLRVYEQGLEQGGATFKRGEGAWYGNGRVYFDCTSGGDSGNGQIWELRRDSQELVLLYESPGPQDLRAPDNICVSPRGGIVLCEDGNYPQGVKGLTPEGEIFDFAVNTSPAAPSSEFAGATFSPGGDVLFFNIQGAGATYAVTGPWTNGAL